MFQNSQATISEQGRKVAETQLLTQLSKTPSTQSELFLQLLQPDNDTSFKDDATPEILKTEEFKTSKSEACLLQFLSNGPQPINQLRKVKRLVPAPKDRGLLEVVDNELHISPRGQLALEQAISQSRYWVKMKTCQKHFYPQKRFSHKKDCIRKVMSFLSYTSKISPISR